MSAKYFLPLKLLFILSLSFIVMASSIKLSMVTDEDMVEIVRQTLDFAIIKKGIPDYNLLKDKENIVISTENIKQNWLPKLSGVNLILMTPEEIQKKANSEGDYLYILFNTIEIKDSSKIEVSIYNIWAVSEKNSSLWIISGGGCTIKYYKENEKWEAEPIIECFQS